MAQNTLYDFNKTASSNTDIAGISVAEGWLPSTVNNYERAWMAIVRKDLDDKGGQGTVGGTANAVTVTSVSPASYGSLINGLRLLFKPGSDNSGATTLNLDALGAKAVRKISGGTDVALVAGDLLAGKRAEIVYDTTVNTAAGGWVLLNQNNPVTGGQVVFPATLNASANANTLDDYAEFTWTLVAAFSTVGTSSWAYGTRNCQGVKVGTSCVISMDLSITPTIGTGAGVLTFTGFPYLGAVNTPLSVGSMNANWAWPASRTFIAAQLGSDGSIILKGEGSAVASSQLAATNMTTGVAHALRISGGFPVQ